LALVIPNFSTTFSEVIPIGIKQSFAFSLVKMDGCILYSSNVDIIEFILIDSAPAPIPISIYPLLIAFAIVITD
jgi:hypothetical protein